jgi:hypothetical protein
MTATPPILPHLRRVERREIRAAGRRVARRRFRSGVANRRRWWHPLSDMTSDRSSTMAREDTARPRVDLDPLIVQAAREVDRTLLDWALSLSPRERLRACTNASAALRRFTNASSRSG